jgi:predicted nucleic acid-binding protein
MRLWLIDTGPIVAYLDARDPAHATVAACLDSFQGGLFTTEAIIVEAMHFLSAAEEGPVLLADFVEASEMRVSACCRPDQLGMAAGLMSKYADTPMDFADATLVLLADEKGILEILTLDRRGFSTYRTSRGKPFRRVLDLA